MWFSDFNLFSFFEQHTARHGILVVRLKQTILMTRKLKRRLWCQRRRRNKKISLSKILHTLVKVRQIGNRGRTTAGRGNPELRCCFPRTAHSCDGKQFTLFRSYVLVCPVCAHTHTHTCVCVHCS